MENSFWKGQWTCRKAVNRMKDADLKGTEYECVASIYLAQERGQVTNSSEYANESSDTTNAGSLLTTGQIPAS